MQGIDSIRETFHLVAALLVWPVLLGLIGLGLYALISIGAFGRQWWSRRRGWEARRLRQDRDELTRIAAGSLPDLDLQLEEALQRAERRRWQSLGFLRLAVRLGPSLGLMGTLIPMADALQGLADGDLPTLAKNMVTAFAATVIGLAISVVAFLITSARASWVRDDNQALALHAERLLRQHQPSAPPAAAPLHPQQA